MMNQFDAIRPFYDYEIQDALQSIADDPMLEAILQFTFPNQPDAEKQALLNSINSTYDFQHKIVYLALKKILAQSAESLTHSGFDKLDKNTAYLYISNHRDILLDTSLLNMILLEQGLIMTASAIGNNLVRIPTLNTLSRLNRNFLVMRNLSPRELLESSKTLSTYVQFLLAQKRSVWIAQREGRTKNGNDATHTGVLKMLSMAAERENLGAFWRKMKIVPVSISYEYDPTDKLKIPELLANKNNETYTKHETEDFNAILKGLSGQKKRIHLHAGDVLDTALDEVIALDNANMQIKNLAQLIDKQIIGNYRLWTTNFIAYDLLCHPPQYSHAYTAEEKQAFENRMASRINPKDEHARELFLEMYANPVRNKSTFADF
jgi:1-acyl-sn-glycerol-3-phosphate acyltransferase